MSWFTEIEEVAYSMVEYIPYVGTVYSLKRAIILYKQRDWQNHWQSLGNLLESSIRDIILTCEYAEPTDAIILHTMAESFTDKVIEIYHSEPKNPKVRVNNKLDKENGHILIAESSMGKNKSLIFEGKAKGVHHFHGAVFTGTLTNPKYAPNGVKIQLEISQGLYDGARVTFSWKWTHNYWTENPMPEATCGSIRLEAGTPTKFGLSKRKGAGEWQGYDFWGKIMSKDRIIAKTTIDGRETEIDSGGYLELNSVSIFKKALSLFSIRIH